MQYSVFDKDPIRHPDWYAVDCLEGLYPNSYRFFSHDDIYRNVLHVTIMKFEDGHWSKIKDFEFDRVERFLTGDDILQEVIAYMESLKNPKPSIVTRENARRTNCVNCGAPLHGHICEYCGTEYEIPGDDVVLYADGKAVMSVTRDLYSTYQSMGGNACVVHLANQLNEQTFATVNNMLMSGIVSMNDCRRNYIL